MLALLFSDCLQMTRLFFPRFLALDWLAAGVQSGSVDLDVFVSFLQLLTLPLVSQIDRVQV